jgi:hypothetical protein
MYPSTGVPGKVKLSAGMLLLLTILEEHKLHQTNGHA